jgi:hypothetical protein
LDGDAASGNARGAKGMVFFLARMEKAWSVFLTPPKSKAMVKA